MLESVTSAMAALRYRDLHAFGPRRDLLEVGCGTGEFLMAARQAGHRVVGLDLSEEAVTSVRRRFPDLDLRCATLGSNDLRPESFDVVAALHVVEHVPDPVDLLRQMTRLLRPGGLVYVRVPNLNAWYRRVLGRNWWCFGIEHAAHFTDISLRLALGQAGLRVVAVRSGDSDLEHSMWPILPLMLGRGALLRLLGSALQPSAPQDRGGCLRIPPGPRVAVKKGLIAGYLRYRRAATAMLTPLTRLQLERGGGPELVALGRKPELG
jgi:SAM-dependent methyltransferase